MESQTPLNTPVKVLIDEMPLTLNSQIVSDYSAYQILSLTSLPLTVTHNNQIKGLAASDWARSEDGRQYTFKLKPGLRWSDGSPIQAQDYVRTIQTLRLNKAARFSRLLVDLEPGANAVLATHDEIVFRLQRPNYFFPEILSLVCFSPTHSESSSVSAGAYQILETAHHNVTLQRNAFYKCDTPWPVEAIQFTKIIDQQDAGVVAVLNGELDRSCDTAFPYEKYSQMKSVTIRKSRHMAMVITFGQRGDDIGREVYDLLFAAIDKKQISEELYGVMAPLNSYFDLFNITAQSILKTKPAVPLRERTCVQIAYENYYPNLEVIQIIKRQLAPHNIILEPIVEAYGSRSASTHLRLEIRQSPIASPYLFFRSELSQKSFADTADELVQSARACFANYQSTGSEAELSKLNSIVAAKQGSYPLFEIPGVYVQSQKLSRENDFTPGQVWSYQC